MIVKHSILCVCVLFFEEVVLFLLQDLTKIEGKKEKKKVFEIPVNPWKKFPKLYQTQHIICRNQSLQLSVFYKNDRAIVRIYLDPLISLMAKIAKYAKAWKEGLYKRIYSICHGREHNLVANIQRSRFSLCVEIKWTNSSLKVSPWTGCWLNGKISRKGQLEHHNHLLLYLSPCNSVSGLVLIEIPQPQTSAVGIPSQAVQVSVTQTKKIKIFQQVRNTHQSNYMLSDRS